MGANIEAFAVDEALDQPLYRLGHIAAAAGIPPATLRTWLYRNFLAHERADERGNGPGHYSRFTLRTALRVALTAEQVRWGVHPQLAGQNARKFTDMDPGQSGWVDDLADAEHPWRNSGECYPLGSTWFVLQSATGFASVIHVPTDRDTKDLIADLIPPTQFSVLIIDLNTLVFRVRYSLSARAQLVMDAEKTDRRVIAGVVRAGVPVEHGAGTATALDDSPSISSRLASRLEGADSDEAKDPRQLAATIGCYLDNKHH